MIQNHCLYFSFLCSDIAHNKATQETNITLIEEKEKDLLKDYLPDENIINVWVPFGQPSLLCSC